MSPADAIRQDEEFSDLLAACDEALAAEVAPPTVADVGVAPDVAPRLERGLRCLRRLQEMRGQHRSIASASNSAALDSDAASGSPDVPLTRLGRFTLQRELGRGGFGIVYLAYDPTLRREVALKVPHASALVTPELRGRFRHEAQAAAALDHPNVVPVYEVGEAGPLCYLISAYCPGTTLAHWLKQRIDGIPYLETAALVQTLADAIAHAHDRGVLHRDLKP